jgi:hypothetical protein
MAKRQKAVEFEFDFDSFVEGLEAYSKATGKSLPEVINRAGQKAAVGGGRTEGGAPVKGALQLTKKATKGAIDKWKPNVERKSKRTRERSRIAYVELARKGITAKDGTLKIKADRVHSQKQSASGYSKAIWIGVAKQFPITGKKLNSKFKIEHGKIGVKPAKGLRLEADILVKRLSTRNDFSNMMIDAWRKGLAGAAVDMLGFATKKMQKIADDHSSK